jgi:eukaryotic-like serine/threonine-protein kinase
VSRMTPERWRQVEALFDEVVDLSGWQRAAALDARCADDPTLRREVEALLTSSEQARDMFEAPPVQVARAFISETTDRDDVLPGQVIGAYRILRLLGRGGMGAVYLAERADGYFQKQVALKIVKRGMDTDEIVARFRRERQILARLQHPNIADLYDGGVTPNGLPYFVMELADGEPIDRFLDARRCTIDARLDLFIRVCEAVQYAHRNLVVHRDLKPSNIMICEGEPKLLDFGIAKVLEEEGGPAETTQITSVFARRLTPAYAAPEQVTGGMTTTATDVYSLGVILYELLTGKLPMDAPAATQTDPERRTADPKPPSVLLGRLGGKSAPSDETDRIADARNSTPRLLQERLAGDLDAIVLKALQEEPERRYGTAAALAEDLRRHLEGRPVAAQPDTQLYRWSKFVRRNRKTVVLAGAAVVALMLGMTGTGWQAWQATQARNAQGQAAQSAAAARDFLLGMIANQDPEATEGQTTFTRDELLGWGRDNLEQLSDQTLLYASVMNTLAQVTFSMGDRAGADSLYRRAYELLLPLGAETDLAVSMMGIGEVEHAALRFDEAIRWFRQALATRRRILPPNPTDVARTMQALAFALYSSETEEGLAEAESLYTELLRVHPEQDEIRAAALEGLGDLRLETGDAASAVDLYRQAIEARSDGVRGQESKNARTRWGMAQALADIGRTDEAERAYRDALTTLRSTFGNDHPHVFLAYYFLGHFYFSNQRYEEAEAELRTAADISSRVSPQGDRFTAHLWLGLGQVHFSQGEFTEAGAAFQQAQRVAQATERRGAGEVVEDVIASTNVWLARMPQGSGGVGGAIPDLRAAYAAATRQASTAPDTRVLANALASVFRRLGQADSAAVYAALARSNQRTSVSRPSGS